VRRARGEGVGSVDKAEDPKVQQVVQILANVTGFCPGSNKWPPVETDWCKTANPDCAACIAAWFKQLNREVSEGGGQRG